MYVSLLLICGPTLALAVPTWSWFVSQSIKQQEPLSFASSVGPASDGTDWTKSGWADPRINGGRLLDFTTPQLGEPVNIIISGLSDPHILTHTGLHRYAKSIGFSEECLGMHIGALHDANLGDGDGRKSEQFLARQHYFPIWGTCWESLVGGNHFRAWKQNGTLANSGAWFLAASKEKYVGDHHLIEDDGYNRGRDFIVERALAGGRWRNMWWKAEVEWKEGLLQRGAEGVNHNISQDGLVAILTVHRL